MKKGIFPAIILSCIVFSNLSLKGMTRDNETGHGELSAKRTFYVDASGGDDWNNGRSESKAWRTLSHISNQTFSPGDSILLKRDEIWRESLILKNSSGSPEDPITIGAYGSGEKPRINGASISKGWKNESDVIYRKSFAHDPRVIIQDKILLTYLIWDTDVPTTFAGASPGCWAGNPQTKTAYVWCRDSADPDSHTMEVSAAGRNGIHEYGIRIKDVSDIVVQDIEITNTTYSGIRIQPSAGQNTDNIILRRLEVSHAGKSGIEATNPKNSESGIHEISGLIVENCIIHDTNYHGIILIYGVDGANIRDNTVFRTGWSQDGSHGISSWSNKANAYVHDCIIEGNTVYEVRARASNGVEGAGIQADDLTRDCVYRYNTSHNNEGSGLYFNGTSGCLFHYNICYGNGSSTKNSPNFRGGISLSNPIDVEVHNNVCTGNSHCGIGWWGSRTDGLSIKNNIFSENALYEIRSGTDTGLNVVCDYNCVFHPREGIFLMWLGAGKSWEDWKNIPGQHAHSIREEPLYADAPNKIFDLKPGSPCIDAGVDVGLKKDRHGNEVPQGKGVDIGAGENTCNKPE